MGILEIRYDRDELLKHIVLGVLDSNLCLAYGISVSIQWQVHWWQNMRLICKRLVGKEISPTK